MRRLAYIMGALALIATGCTHLAKTKADRDAAVVDKLYRMVGQTVRVSGKFSLGGKLAPYVLYRGKPVYLVHSGSFTWGKPYSEFEGKRVLVTGTLHFYASPPAPDNVILGLQRSPDHFWFNEESVKIQLAGECSAM